jgi:hypothetical protein
MRRHVIGELPYQGRPFPLAFGLIWISPKGIGGMTCVNANRNTMHGPVVCPRLNLVANFVIVEGYDGR